MARSHPVVGSLGPYVFAMLAILSIWQLAVVALAPPPSILPSPTLVGQTLLEEMSSGALFVNAGISLARVSVAWVLSAVIAIPLGVFMARSRLAERLIDPVIELFRPISPLAWIPLAILWFGIGESGKVFIIFVATFFPIVLNTVSGVKRVDPVLIRAGRVLGCARQIDLFWRVIFPASLPSILVGLRISFGTGWAAIIAAELVASNSGLGYLIADGMEILRSDLVMVGMAAIGVIGVLVDAVFKVLQTRFG
ncbi:MAG: ABC transporter permease [Rhodospirillum sp.]|nr:ABC transporter permease [Rhodospirillum sp.]MCF8491518.1 ABC transporter permease [Rhodospirillum sp.]MCF8502153.1 ABC transporter permease [Rhodospirillum sp.]